MKKAEEYFDYMLSEDDIIELYSKSKEDFIKAIKQAQIDAVEHIKLQYIKEARKRYDQALNFIKEKFLYHNEKVTIDDIEKTIEIAAGFSTIEPTND